MSPDGRAAAPRVVAIGASAGGLEPLEQLFAGLPEDTGCSFVIVQHLSPDFRSMMGELLARRTGMPIERLAHGMTLAPDRIYLNLPRVTATLADGAIALQSMDDPEDLYRPIDRFLASLAEACGERALAIILSGTASDGTEGAARIREHGGQVIAQTLSSARFESMPRAVMDAGLDNASGDPAMIADLVVRWAGGETLSAEPVQRIPGDPVGSILALLHREHDTDFTSYKPATIHRRIARRAELRHCRDLDAYLDLLTETGEELDELYGDLLIEVTTFFRDIEAFAEIATRIVPALVEKMGRGEALRLWVPGCASGEEAYSIAMLLIERAGQEGVPVNAKILATDVHGRSLERASAGEYPLASVQHLSIDRVNRFFDRHEHIVKVKSEVRRSLLFSTHDVLRDAPFTRIDLLSCRNLLIYFNDRAQARVLGKFHAALHHQGFLVLGPSESTAGLDEGFEVLDPRWRLYRKRGDAPLHEPIAWSERVGLPSNASRSPATPLASPRVYTPLPRPMLPDERTLRFRRAHSLALEQIVGEFAPPGFLLDGNGDIVHIFGDAGRLLPLQQGAFSRRITNLIRMDFRAVLFAALQRADDPAFERLERRLHVREPDEPVPVAYDLVLASVATPDEGKGFLLLTIRRIDQPMFDAPGAVRGVSSAAPPDAPLPASPNALPVASPDASVPTEQQNDSAILNQRIRLLEHSLHASEQSLQTTIEELQTSNEELQSTNEELTASNEELQSTNEELHSVNEELYTVSSEHQRKVVELSELDDDMQLLLQGSEIGTVHLDRSLRIKRFSSMAGTLLGLDNARIGRSLEAIAIPAGTFDLAALARSVAENGEDREQQVDLHDRHLMVRARASRDSSGQLGGILISCFDLTELVEVQNRVARIGADFRAIVEDTVSFIVRWNAEDERITFCNEIYAGFFDSSSQQLVGTDLRTLIPDSERAAFFEQVHGIPVDQTRHLSVLRELPDGRITYTVGFTRAIGDEHGRIVEYQSTGQDLSDEYRYRRALEELVGVGHEADGDRPDLLSRILDIGLRYFELDSAFLAGMTDTEYRVLEVAGLASRTVSSGDVLPRERMVCDLLLHDRTVLSLNQLGDSDERHHARCRETGVQAYMGVQLRRFDGMQGVISFSSTSPRRQAFSVADESFLLLVGNWLSTLLDERRRMVVIADENRYYQSLYLNVPVMMFLADERGHIIEISDRLLEQLGSERADRVNRQAIELFRGDDATVAHHALLAGECRDLAVTLSLDDERTLECEMTCQLRDIGSLPGIRMCVLSDVSARNRALDAAEDHNRRLALANENLNQFAFVASHDLQEPLRKIQQFSSFLHDDYAERIDEDGRYHLQVIVAAAERMSTLIKDLLEYSRTNRNGIEPRPLSLRTLVDEVLDELDLRVREAAAEIEIGELPVLCADPMLVRQLFTNLIGNALKYRDDKRPLRLSIGWIGPGDSPAELTLPDDTLPGSPSSLAHDPAIPPADTIEFADNGIGFDPDYAQRIFEPFTRLNTVQEYAGSGIGLAICATVCEKHGWRLTAHGEPGRGSTFRIHLDAPTPSTSAPVS